MVKGIKTIDFDFDITYSKGGQFVATRQITVREPGLGKWEVHSQMTAFVGKAALAFSKLAADMAQPAGDGEAPATDVDVDEEKDLMSLMSMGLGVDEYPKFANYVKKVLTGAPRLAYVGEDQAQAITDEVWESLAENGGMESVTRVMSEFTDFFFMGRAKRQAKRNGADTPPISASPTRAPSPTARRPTSRLQS